MPTLRQSDSLFIDNFPRLILKEVLENDTLRNTRLTVIDTITRESASVRLSFFVLKAIFPWITSSIPQGLNSETIDIWLIVDQNELVSSDVLKHFISIVHFGQLDDIEKESTDNIKMLCHALGLMTSLEEVMQDVASPEASHHSPPMFNALKKRTKRIFTANLSGYV